MTATATTMTTATTAPTMIPTLFEADSVGLTILSLEADFFCPEAAVVFGGFGLKLADVVVCVVVCSDVVVVVVVVVDFVNGFVIAGLADDGCIMHDEVSYRISSINTEYPLKSLSSLSTSMVTVKLLSVLTGTLATSH